MFIIPAILLKSAQVINLSKLILELKDKSQEMKGDRPIHLLKLYLEVFEAVLKELWPNTNNPINKDWGGFDQLNVKTDNLIDNYDVLRCHGRSFVYDLINETIKTMELKKPRCEYNAIKFSRDVVERWRYDLDYKLKSFSSGPLANIPDNDREQILHEFDWASYKLRLRMFPYDSLSWCGYEGGIESIYVEPVATLRNIDKDINGEHGLVKDLKKLVHDGVDYGTKPILITGLPGMGKTSFTKMYSAALAKENPDVYPVFSRIRVLKSRMGSNSWFEAIMASPNIEMTERLVLNDEDLRNKKIILLLDGLDELAMSGADSATLNSFFSAVERICGYEKVQGIITSRPLLFTQEGKENIGRFGLRIRIRLLNESDDKRQQKLIGLLKSAGVLRTEEGTFFDWLTKVDKKNAPDGKMGGQPLLIFLLADAYSKLNDEKRAELMKRSSRTKIYDTIITATLEREYDQSGENVKHYKMARLETIDDARLVLGETAMALYQIGRDFALPLEIEGFLNYVFNGKYRHALRSLDKVFLAFHMAEHEGGGVEFFHKSIGEFLTAETIVRRLRSAVNFYNIQKNIEDFAPRFVELFGPRNIDSHIVEYLVDILESDSKLCNDLLKPLQLFVDGVLDCIWLNKGLTFEISKKHPANPSMNSGMGDPLGYEGCACFAALRLISIIQNAQGYDPPIEIILSKLGKNKEDGSDDRFDFFLLRTRIMRGEILSISPAKADLKDAYLFNGFFFGADLRGADLRDTDLRASYIFRADLSDADFGGADLAGALLWSTTLNRTIFKDSMLREVNFRGSVLEGANFNGACLRDANFRGVDLRKVNLEGTDLQGANLTETKINIKQLYNVKTLYKCNLDNTILNELRKEKPGLFKKPKISSDPLNLFYDKKKNSSGSLKPSARR